MQSLPADQASADQLGRSGWDAKSGNDSTGVPLSTSLEGGATVNAGETGETATMPP